MSQDRWQKITLTFVCLIISGLLLGAQASGQDNDSIPATFTSLPTTEPPTLLQFPFDRPDPARADVPSIPLAASTAVTRTRIITALADTLVTQGYPTANCGDELEMRVGYDTYLNPDAETLHSLIRFNLVSISTDATVHSATLWLFLSGSYDYPGHSVPITPYRISSPWAVDTVTWTSQPSYTESYTPTWVVHGSGVWVPFDVTDLVRHWAAGTYPNYGLVLLNPIASNEWRAFAASETIYPPHLIISYEQSPNVTLTIVPNVQTVIPGQNMSSSSILYLTSTDGFSESTTLDIAGLPPNTSYTWSADSVTPTASTLLTITTTPTTPRGAYTLTITGTSASLVRTTPATLHVLQPDFEISLRPSLRSVWSGEDAYYTAHLTATDGFTAGVMLDVGGLPVDASHTWGANPVTPTTSTLLTITTALDTPGGLYTLSVTGTAGSLVHTSQAALYVSEPDFELSLVPSWRSVRSGESAQYTAFLTATDGFSHSVTLEVGGLPPDTTYGWDANPITPTSSTRLTITTTPDTPRGVYTFTITGTAGSLIHAAQATLHVSNPDFELDIAPPWLSVGLGEDVVYTTYLTATDGFSESVALDVGGLPPNVTDQWSANPVTPTASTSLTLTTTPDTPRGVYTFTITGTSSSLIHTAQASLRVSQPDFELSLRPFSQSVSSGGSAEYTAYLTATEDLTTAVALNVGGLPANATHAWSTNPVTPTGSTLLTITTAPDTPGGLYTLTVTGTSGSLVHAAQAALYVSEPDFELTLEPSLRSVTVGESTHYTAHLVALGGFTGSVMLDADGVPSNTSSEWGSNPVEPTASTVLTIVTTQDTPTGTHSLTVTGTSGAVVHSASVSLTVRSETVFETVYLPLVLRGYPSGDVKYHPWRAVEPPQTSPSAVQDTPVSRIALVIGVADYEHMEPASGTRQEDKTHDLAYSDHDPFDIVDEISRPPCYDGQMNAPLATSYCDICMTMLVDCQATKGAIHAAIINWMDPLEDENTLVIVSFSGHGMYAPDDDGDENDPYDEFIVPHDIDIDGEGHWLPETAISDDELASWLGELESQQIVVFIDSCFAGGMMTDTTNIKGFSWRPAAQSEITAVQWRDSFLQDIQGGGRVVLAATTEEQASWEFGALQNGVFTYYLVEALHSASADINSNGWISAEEAHDYLDGRVDDYVWNHTDPRAHQNPQISDGVSGEVDLTQPVSCDSCPVWW